MQPENQPTQPPAETERVGIFKVNKIGNKKAWEVAGLSYFIPGAGHFFILRQRLRGVIWFIATIVWGTLIGGVFSDAPKLLYFLVALACAFDGYRQANKQLRLPRYILTKGEKRLIAFVFTALGLIFLWLSLALMSQVLRAEQVSGKVVRSVQESRSQDSGFGNSYTTTLDNGRVVRTSRAYSTGETLGLKVQKGTQESINFSSSIVLTLLFFGVLCLVAVVASWRQKKPLAEATPSV